MTKQDFAIINSAINQAYEELTRAMDKWDVAEGDGANETEYGNVKFIHGKITALEEIKRKLRENWTLYKLPIANLIQDL